MNLSSKRSSTTATISADYRVVIPKSVRDRLGLRPGQKVEVLAEGGHIVILPRPFDVPGVDADVSLDDILLAVRESRERDPGSGSA